VTVHTALSRRKLPLQMPALQTGVCNGDTKWDPGERGGRPANEKCEHQGAVGTLVLSAMSILSKETHPRIRCLGFRVKPVFMENILWLGGGNSCFSQSQRNVTGSKRREEKG
jgi:hypothetical protein